jgi:hypothetical protein
LSTKTMNRIVDTVCPVMDRDADLDGRFRFQFNCYTCPEFLQGKVNISWVSHTDSLGT